MYITINLKYYVAQRYVHAIKRRLIFNTRLKVSLLPPILSITRHKVSHFIALHAIKCRVIHGIHAVHDTLPLFWRGVKRFKGVFEANIPMLARFCGFQMRRIYRVFLWLSA